MSIRCTVCDRNFQNRQTFALHFTSKHPEDLELGLKGVYSQPRPGNTSPKPPIQVVVNINIDVSSWEPDQVQQLLYRLTDRAMGSPDA